MRLLSKGCKNVNCLHTKNDDLIRPSLCTCHDSSAAMTFTKVWPDWIIRFKISVKIYISRDFNHELLNCLVNRSQTVFGQHAQGNEYIRRFRALSNRAYHPGGHFWYYHSGRLFLSRVNATHLKIRAPLMKSTVPDVQISCKDLTAW